MENAEFVFIVATPTCDDGSSVPEGYAKVLGRFLKVENIENKNWHETAVQCMNEHAVLTKMKSERSYLSQIIIAGQGIVFVSA